MIESWGRGIERIIDACRTANVPLPKLRYEGAGLWVEFPCRVEGTGTQEEEGNTGQVTSEVTGEVKGEVTEEIHRLLTICRGEMRRTEMQEALGLRGADNFRRLYLKPSLAHGLIEMTIPDKPKSRLQKYRLTAKGKTVLHAVSKKEQKEPAS